MLERSRVWWAAGILALASCATPAPQLPRAAVAVPQPPPAPVKDEASRLEEAKALVAQAETDVQRARAKRALWLKAWEDLLAARRAMASNDPATAMRHAKRA